MAFSSVGIADTLPLSARKCRECGRGGLSRASGDYRGKRRWLCRECRQTYSADYKRRTGAWPIPRALLDKMLEV